MCDKCIDKLKQTGVLGIQNMCPACYLRLRDEVDVQGDKVRENFFLLPLLSLKADTEH